MIPAVITSQLNRFTPRAVYTIQKSNVAKPIASQPVIQKAVTLGGSATPPVMNSTSTKSLMLGSSPAPVTHGLGTLSTKTGLTHKQLVIGGIILVLLAIVFLRK